MLLELQELGKSFGEHEVLQNVNAGVEHRAMQSKYLTACVAIWLMMKLTLRLYGSLRYVFPFLFGFVETDVYIYGRNDKQRQTKMKGYG